MVDGTVEVTLDKENQVEITTFRKGDFFQIRPYTIHSMFYLEDTILVVLYDIPIEQENGEKDIFPTKETTGNKMEE